MAKRKSVKELQRLNAIANILEITPEEADELSKVVYGEWVEIMRENEEKIEGQNENILE